jgi:hypothetical protein
VHKALLAIVQKVAASDKTTGKIAITLLNQLFGADTERKLALRRNQEMLKALCQRMDEKDLASLIS